MLDNNPFSMLLAPFREASIAVAEWVGDRLADLSNFLGISAKPESAPIQEPYTPPFTGGQCSDLYNVTITLTITRTTGTTTELRNFLSSNGQALRGPIRGVRAEVVPDGLFTIFRAWVQFSDISGNLVESQFVDNRRQDNITFSAAITSLSRANGQPDNCGDLPNPNPFIPPEYGAIDSQNPDDGEDGELVYGGLPVLTVAGILAALRAIAEGIAAIGDVLDGINQIGEALKKLTDLLKEIFDGKKEDDKAKPKYRRYAVGQWYALNSIDGLIPTSPVSLDGVNAEPYKLQVIVESFPSTASRLLGVLSPSISIDSLPLFYLLLQEDDYGISAVKPIRTLNSSTSIPPFHRGIFWNFRLNPSISAKYRLFYQTEQIEQELPLLP